MSDGLEPFHSNISFKQPHKIPVKELAAAAIRLPFNRAAEFKKFGLVPVLAMFFATFGAAVIAEATGEPALSLIWVPVSTIVLIPFSVSWTKASGPLSQVGFNFQTPSAVVRIERFGLNPFDVNREIERLIAILRLFCGGSVRWISYQQFSDSLVHGMGGSVINGPHELVHQVGQIAGHDHAKFEAFWNRVEPSLPPDFAATSSSGSEYLAIAYERYSAALTRMGLLEERIAQAVMGLEAILINETQELAYKLRIRTAKLLSFLGEAAIHVSNVLTDAYSVRSTFAHGDRLSYKRMRKLDRRYQPATNLLSEVLTILRKTLVTGILISKGKDQLIDLIDEALIDQRRHAELLSPA